MDKNSFFQRTMHTPDSPERAALRQALRDLSKALLPLHRHLIDAAKSDYNFAFGKDVGPTQLVELLQTDPFFAWLKPLTAIIVGIDEMVRTDFDPADVAAIVARVEGIFGEKQYRDALQNDVEVASGHATVRRVLQQLKA